MAIGLVWWDRCWEAGESVCRRSQEKEVGGRGWREGSEWTSHLLAGPSCCFVWFLRAPDRPRDPSLNMGPGLGSQKPTTLEATRLEFSSQTEWVFDSHFLDFQNRRLPTLPALYQHLPAKRVLFRCPSAAQASPRGTRLRNGGGGRQPPALPAAVEAQIWTGGEGLGGALCRGPRARARDWAPWTPTWTQRTP